MNPKEKKIIKAALQGIQTTTKVIFFLYLLEILSVNSVYYQEYVEVHTKGN